MDACFVGIWIDHEIAQVVQVGDHGATTSMTIESRAERRRRMTGQTEGPQLSHQTSEAESHDRNRRSNQFTRYYDRVIKSLPECAGIVIMGPGFAKRELWSRIKEYGTWDEQVLGVQTTPKIPVPQIAARVRDVAASRSDRREQVTRVAADQCH